MVASVYRSRRQPQEASAEPTLGGLGQRARASEQDAAEEDADKVGRVHWTRGGGGNFSRSLEMKAAVLGTIVERL